MLLRSKGALAVASDTFYCRSSCPQANKLMALWVNPGQSFRMRRSQFACPLILVMALTAVEFAHARDHASEPTVKGPECAIVTADVAMEAYGFTHLVRLSNRCEKPVQCEVWTDVDPTPHLVLRANPAESASVVARRGSPARAVQPGGICQYD